MAMQKRDTPVKVTIDTGEYRADIPELLRTIADDLEAEGVFPEKEAGFITITLGNRKHYNVQMKPLQKGKQVKTLSFAKRESENENS
jgi:hypothetical protein